MVTKRDRKGRKKANEKIDIINITKKYDGKAFK